LKKIIIVLVFLAAIMLFIVQSKLFIIAKNINTQSHRGARQQFSQHFIQTGELPLELSKALRITYDLRQLGDYDQVVEITREQTQIALEYATLFIEKAKTWLNTH